MVLKNKCQEVSYCFAGIIYYGKINNSEVKMNNRDKYVFNILMMMVIILVLFYSFLILRDYSRDVNLKRNEAATNQKETLKGSNDIDDQETTQEEINEQENNQGSLPDGSELKDFDKSVNNNKNNNNNNNPVKEEPSLSDGNSSSGYNPVTDVTSSIVESYKGKITGYGPDCYGCTTLETASGMYIGGGNIYYQDSIFGRIRIVAADKRYPFGTIVRISNLSIYQESILAVVLDRGGAIGDGKQANFDLLFESEAKAAVVGITSANFEILRLGY